MLIALLICLGIIGALILGISIICVPTAFLLAIYSDKIMSLFRKIKNKLRGNKRGQKIN